MWGGTSPLKLGIWTEWGKTASLKTWAVSTSGCKQVWSVWHHGEFSFGKRQHQPWDARHLHWCPCFEPAEGLPVLTEHLLEEPLRWWFSILEKGKDDWSSAKLRQTVPLQGMTVQSLEGWAELEDLIPILFTWQGYASPASDPPQNQC